MSSSTGIESCLPGENFFANRPGRHDLIPNHLPLFSALKREGGRILHFFEKNTEPISQNGFYLNSNSKTARGEYPQRAELRTRGNTYVTKPYRKPALPLSAIDGHPEDN